MDVPDDETLNHLNISEEEDESTIEDISDADEDMHSDTEIEDSDSSSFDEDTYSSERTDDDLSTFYMILAFYLRHNLTWIALQHLLKLINKIKPGAAKLDPVRIQFIIGKF